MNNQQFIFVMFGSAYLFGLTGILIVMRIDRNQKKRERLRESHPPSAPTAEPQSRPRSAE